MILFGLAEVATGFSHHFLGLHTTEGRSASYAAAAIGLLYAIAGLLVLTMRRAALAAALVLLGIVVAGRVAMVVTGLYPMDSLQQSVGIVMGTSIAIAFAAYILVRLTDRA